MKGTISRLSEARAGETVVIEGLDAGRGLRRRLLAMGIVPGDSLSVVRAENSGPIVVFVKGSRVMLGRGIAAKILVKIIEPIKSNGKEPKKEHVLR